MNLRRTAKLTMALLPAPTVAMFAGPVLKQEAYKENIRTPRVTRVRYDENETNHVSDIDISSRSAGKYPKTERRSKAQAASDPAGMRCTRKHARPVGASARGQPATGPRHQVR